MLSTNLQKAATLASRDDLIDLVILFMYLFAGGRQAALIARSLHDDLQRIIVMDK